MSPDFSDLLQTLGLPLSPSQIALLTRHFHLLQKWNRKINLTSLRRPDQILTRHFGESLFLAVHLPPASTVADIGSGAGFPGLPLAIARPELQVTLIESVAKKAAFLKEAARGLPNVRVLQARFEEVRENFDWLTLRAIAPPPDLSKRSGCLAILTTRPRLPVSGWTTQATFPLPWGSERVLALMFHVEHCSRL